MFGIINYGSFVVSSIMLNMTPGSDTVYVLTRSAVGGRKKGVVSALGISFGILIHTLLAALGLSVILSQSPLLFNAVRFAGAGYLAVLGIKALISEGSPLSSDENIGDETLLRVFARGALTNLLNPKAALFFLSFLPQFVSPDNAHGPLPFLFLGLTFFTTSTVWSVFLAFVSSYANKLLQKSKAAQNAASKLTGIIYILLGLNILRVKTG